MSACSGLPDADNAHVVAAALKTQAAVIVTEDLGHFPPFVLRSLDLEVRPDGVFVADTIALAPPRGP